ncbi:hypothetical protein DFJ74DRAFT_76052 [Hyaloraphidium curvatum]|nr:hypothetical protein DFJ74DRAFT_76052 [Hyaloraphidium curvatum]
MSFGIRRALERRIIAHSRCLFGAQVLEVPVRRGNRVQDRVARLLEALLDLPARVGEGRRDRRGEAPLGRGAGSVRGGGGRCTALALHRGDGPADGGLDVLPCGRAEGEGGGGEDDEGDVGGRHFGRFGAVVFALVRVVLRAHFAAPVSYTGGAGFRDFGGGARRKLRSAAVLCASPHFARSARGPKGSPKPSRISSETPE